MKTNNLYAQLSVGQGPAGPVGPQGPKGDKGDKGETGPVGPQGPKGDKGERGARGPQGNQGAQGKQGPQGPVGLRGEKGEKGDRGPQGIQGIQGPKGDKGDTGAQGPKGERGEKGEKGDSGGVMPSDMVDYVGNQHKSLKAKNDADVEYAVKTAIGEFNYLDYDGQHITATDSIEGRSKSAILKGQTLVNIVRLKKLTTDAVFNRETGEAELLSSTGWIRFDETLMKPSTKYLIILDIKEATIGTNEHPLKISLGNGSNNYINVDDFTVGRKIFIQESYSTIAADYFNIQTRGDASCKFKLMVLEYVEGMENWDIPYFQGMQSVKMPVLTTTGKNLYPYDDISRTSGNTVNIWKTDILVKNGQTLTYSGNGFTDATDKRLQLIISPVKNQSIAGEVVDQLKGVTLTDFNGYKTLNITNDTGKDGYLFVRIVTGDASYSINSVQIEQGTQATSYEPYKSNILTVNEDVTLHGIGNVKDELDCLTGKVTERIGEVVFDGSDDENWYIDMLSNDSTRLNMTFKIDLDNIMDFDHKTTGILCDRFTQISGSSLWANDVQGVGSSNGNGIKIGIPKSNLTTQDVNGFKTWLSQNHVAVQYQLKTPTIKAVDLSDNHVYSYKDVTHYDCSSAEGSLVPTLSVKVPTKLNALVARQKDTIQELTQENESLKAAQQILLNSQLSFYESLVSTIPALMPAEGQAIIPDFIQDLYRLKNNQK